MSLVTIQCRNCRELERENAALKTVNKELCDSLDRLEAEVESLKLDRFLGEFKYYRSLKREPVQAGWVKRLLLRRSGG